MRVLKILAIHALWSAADAISTVSDLLIVVASKIAPKVDLP